jgi:N-acetylglucosaminyl-diphospho-decaprenol L-rhamnosyltransferase
LADWSIITVTYNSADALRQFWSGGILGDIEWIVVDNASSDRSAELAEDLGAARVIRQPSNRGFSHACNSGLRQASGRYIAFVNPDVTVDCSSLPALEGLPTLYNKVINRIMRPDGANDYYRYVEPGESQYVWWLIGAAVCGRRATFERLGGWNERYFVYYEDSDLCLRAWHAGVPVKLVGDARWIHGWARDTSSFRIEPWKRELAAMRVFYSSYPALILGSRVASRLLRIPVLPAGVGVSL